MRLWKGYCDSFINTNQILQKTVQNVLPQQYVYKNFLQLAELNKTSERARERKRAYKCFSEMYNFMCTKLRTGP